MGRARELRDFFLNELKALYDVGKLTRGDLLATDRDGWAVLDYIAWYPDNLNKLKWLYEVDLFIEKDCRSGVLNFIASSADGLDVFKWLYKIGFLKKKYLSIKSSDNRYTVFHAITTSFSSPLDIFNMFKWLCKKDLFKKEDLYIKNKYGKTVFYYLSKENKEKVLALFDNKKEEKTND